MLTALLTVTLTAVQSPDSAEALAARVEIVRTEYGIPHILAADLKAMGFGLGYVQSEDCLLYTSDAADEHRDVWLEVVGVWW